VRKEKDSNILSSQLMKISENLQARTSKMKMNLMSLINWYWNCLLNKRRSNHNKINKRQSKNLQARIVQMILNCHSTIYSHRVLHNS